MAADLRHDGPGAAAEGTERDATPPSAATFLAAFAALLSALAALLALASLSALAAGLGALATAQQEPACRRLFAGSSESCALLYVAMRATGALQPRGLGAADSAAWRARGIPTINAAILTAGSLRCFAEWHSYEPPREAFISNHLWYMGSAAC